jgi:hypothetical protein
MHIRQCVRVERAMCKRKLHVCPVAGFYEKVTVIKDKAVDPAFGTGVMTITPWHDATDFEIAERHKLEKKQVIGFDGKLLDIAEEFAGMKIDDARPKIAEKLKEKGLLVKVDEKYVHNVAVSYRGKGKIEPQIKEQPEPVATSAREVSQTDLNTFVTLAVRVLLRDAIQLRAITEKSLLEKLVEAGQDQARASTALKRYLSNRNILIEMVHAIYAVLKKAISAISCAILSANEIF